MQIEFYQPATPSLVSIVVPCYNAERFLPETLESVFAQTYPHKEIIVIDDGSTDRTPELIRSYGARLRSEFGPNRGASAARNRGTALAKGEFIQYLDADDMLVPTSVAQRVAALHERDADVAYSDWEKLVELEDGSYEVGERVARRIEDLDPNPAIAFLHFWSPPAALTYRRRIVEKIGGWKEWLPIIQDARFLHDAGLLGGRFVHAPGIGARYRVHRGVSLSRNSAAAFVRDCFRNASDLQTVFEDSGRLNPDERRILADIYGYAARSLFFHDREAFRDCVARLYQVEPGFRPTWPKTARLTSALFGFRVAGVMLTALTQLRAATRRPTRKPSQP